MSFSPRLFEKKLGIVRLFIISSFLLIFVVLFRMQVYEFNFFSLRGQRNFLRYETISSLRGAIIDKNGRALATNRPVVTLVWCGTGRRRFSREQLTVLKKIDEILGTSFSENNELLLCEIGKREYEMFDDLTFDKLGTLFEGLTDCGNIVFRTRIERYYPYKTVAGHILGYFRNIGDERAGKMGLEKLFESKLSGVDGELEKTVDSVGRSIFAKEVQKAMRGADVVTTIDLELQLIAEEVFDQKYTGALIVMNPHNGELNVVLSRPSFDPNIFLRRISFREWEELKKNKPFINRALNAGYPPASIMKLISTALGLEEGILNVDDSYVCKGKIKFGGRTFLCNRAYVGHGKINLEEALAESCNIPFYEVGKKVDIDILAEYAKKFGLGEKTGTIFPEKSGLVPTSEWKRRTHGEPWYRGETVMAAIGQSYFLVTTLQVARMIGAICTGYLVRPRILLDEPMKVTPLNISHKTCSFLQYSMRKTVLTGTGKQLNELKDMEIYAKTGTGQTSHRSKRKLGEKFLEHAWFVSYAKYKEHEPIVLVILIENVGSGKFATKVARKFLSKYCEYIDRKHQFKNNYN